MTLDELFKEYGKACFSIKASTQQANQLEVALNAELQKKPETEVDSDGDE